MLNFKQSNQNLIISVEEYPTVNEISFEGNKKFTDEKLSSFIETKSRFVFTPKEVLEKDVFSYRKCTRIQEEFQLVYSQKL